MILATKLCMWHAPFRISSSKLNSNSKTGFSTVNLPLPALHKPNVFNGIILDRPMTNHGTRQSLVELLHECAKKGLLCETKSVHGYILKSEFSKEDLLVLLNHVAHVYSKSLDLDAAHKLFDKMTHRNAFSWTVLIVGSTVNGHFNVGLKFFYDMQYQGFSPDKHTICAVIQACIGLNCIGLGKTLHAQIVVRGLASYKFCSISLLTMYAKFGEMEYSYKVFQKMENHSHVSWNAMISGFTSNGLYKTAFDHLIKMRSEGFTPNVFTLISISKAVGELGDVSMSNEVHNYASQLGMESDVVVGTALIDMFSKCGSLMRAKSVFNSSFTKCGVNGPWNAMISGYSHCGRWEEALEHYLRMLESGIKPDIYTYCSIFSTIASLKHLRFGREVHGVFLKCGSSLKSINNAIADMYSKCGSFDEVRRVFNTMEERDTVSWTIMVTAYSQLSSQWEETFSIFAQMREHGFFPNQFTFATLLATCSNQCLFGYGQQFHGLIFKSGFHTEKCVESGMIDMYAKCGFMDDMMRVFRMITDPDVVSWTAVIFGCARHGLVDTALHLFKKMEHFSIKPNSVTLLCVLFACSHSGRVDEGLRYFQKMENDYGIVPEMEHYACVVDALGRDGRLNEAIEFVKQMPIEANELVWESLLGGCRVHGGVELGEIVGRRILSMKPRSSAAHVLVSNMYAEMGRFRSGIRVRNDMKKKGVSKDPGHSWILVKGGVHKFYACDQHHPQKEEIYGRLQELRENMKTLSYVSDL